MGKTQQTTTTTMVATKKEGEEPIKQEVFISKNIVNKKKNPQQKLERYYSVTKSKGRVAEKKFQGFPLRLCKFEEEIGKFIYCPPCYTNKLEERQVKEAELCHECYLRPCVVKGKWEDIMGFCEDVMVFENDDSDAMYFKMVNHVESVLVEIFGARYVRNFPPPSCVYNLVGRYHDTKREMEEEEHPDDGFGAAAIDGKDYVLE